MNGAAEVHHSPGSAPSYFDALGPAQILRNSAPACHLTITAPPSQPELAMDVVEHWLAEFAARALFDAARYAVL
jgi:hypothetical protein